MVSPVFPQLSEKLAASGLGWAVLGRTGMGWLLGTAVAWLISLHFLLGRCCTFIFEKKTEISATDFNFLVYIFYTVEDIYCLRSRPSSSSLLGVESAGSFPREGYCREASHAEAKYQGSKNTCYF